MPDEVATQAPPAPETPPPAPAPAAEPAAAPKTFFKTWDTAKGEVVALEDSVPDDAPPKPAEPPKTEETKPKLEFKSQEAAEESWRNAQKKMHEALAERDRLKQELDAAQKKSQEAQTSTQARTDIAQHVDKKVEETRADLADMLINNPQQFEQSLVDKARESLRQEMESAQRVHEIRENWRKQNSDIAQYEDRIAMEVKELLAAHPEKGRENPAELLNEATGRFRQFLGEVRKQGEQAALTVRETVMPLGASSVAQKATEPPAREASGPTQNLDPLADELARRKAEHMRVTGMAEALKSARR